MPGHPELTVVLFDMDFNLQMMMMIVMLLMMMIKIVVFEFLYSATYDAKNACGVMYAETIKASTVVFLPDSYVVFWRRENTQFCQ